MVRRHCRTGSFVITFLGFVTMLCAPVSQGAVSALDLCQTYKADLGVAFAGKANARGLLAGTVQTPQKFMRLGLKDVQMNEAVRFQAQADGNVKVTIPRLNREHILLGPANGGWWPILGSGAGFQPDNAQRIGARVAAVGGTVGNPALLERLGASGVAKGQRTELYSGVGIIGQDFDLAMPQGPMPSPLYGFVDMEDDQDKSAFVMMFLDLLGQMALPAGLPDPTEQVKFASAMAERGVAMLRGKTGTPAEGYVSRTGLVYDVAKFQAFGLAGAKEKDHVHLIPKGKGWQMALYRPTTKDPVAFRVNDKGVLERVEVKRK